MGAFLRWFLFALSLTTAATAEAAWHKASTRHFIIYSEQKPAELRAYAERLERFDQAVRVVKGMDDPAVGDGNRLTLFLLADGEAVRRLHRGGGSFIQGFYVGRYTGPIAFAPRKTSGDSPGSLKAEAVFFHEYSHHLMFQRFDQPYPNWYVEGFAELFSTPKFGGDGSVTLGIAPMHRAYGLFSGEGLTTREILESQPQKLTPADRESIYGRGWLLTHFLEFELSRKGQLARYFANLAGGQAMGLAAASAFGDLKQFDRELRDYVLRRRLKSVTVAGSALKPGSIEVQPLSPGGDQALPWLMISKRGVDAATARTVVEKLRPIGMSYPTDAMVQASVAEAEYDAGNHAASLAAADAAIRVSPRSVEAYLHRGRALTMLAQKADKAGSFDLARDAFLAANKIDAEDPEPLYLFFQSYPAEGRRPTANAFAALHYASALAPNDDGLRFNSALAWLDDGKLAEARIDLLPIAYNPHGGPESQRARAAIELIDARDAKAARKAITPPK